MNPKWRVGFELTLVLATVSSCAVLLVGHASNYFFLFDDFALVGESRGHTLASLFNAPLFGFYRPVVFALVKAQSQLFGWQRPWGYRGLLTRRTHIERGALGRAVEALQLVNTSERRSVGVVLHVAVGR